MAKIQLTKVAMSSDMLKSASALLETLAPKMKVNLPEQMKIWVDTDTVRSFTEPYEVLEGKPAAFKIFYKGLPASEGTDVIGDDYEKFLKAWRGE